MEGAGPKTIAHRRSRPEEPVQVGPSGRHSKLEAIKQPGIYKGVFAVADSEVRPLAKRFRTESKNLRLMLLS